MTSILEVLHTFVKIGVQISRIALFPLKILLYTLLRTVAHFFMKLYGYGSAEKETIKHYGNL
jgi:hypothetical protein